MSRHLLILACLVMTIGCELKPPAAPSSVQEKPVVGRSAITHEARFEYLSGGQGAFNLAALKGSVVILDVCAPWSPISHAQAQELNQLQQREANSGLVVIGLVVDADATMGLTPELQGIGAAYPLVAAPRALLQRYEQVRSVPARLLVDRKGQVRKHYAGFVSPDAMQQDVLALLKE